MSNYPPGVTGNEYAISGPQREWEAIPLDECGYCHVKNYEVVIWQSHYEHGSWWICPHCEETNEATDTGDPYDYSGYDDIDDSEPEDWDEFEHGGEA
jgi:hypothetical protein